METVWWLGDWRAGEQLYRWTTAVSPHASPERVAEHVRSRVSTETWAGVATGPSLPAASFVSADETPWQPIDPWLSRVLTTLPGSVDADVQARRSKLRERLEK